MNEKEPFFLAAELHSKVRGCLEDRSFLRYDKNEYEIRWKRTVGKIFEDGFFYSRDNISGDLVVAYQGLAKARGFDTRFVLIHNSGFLLPLAEIKINDEWHYYEVQAMNAMPKKGQFIEGTTLKGWDGWNLLAKGQDAWDLGLQNYEAAKLNLLKRS